MMPKGYEIVVPPWAGITQQEVAERIARDLSLPDADLFQVMEWATSKLQAPLIELLLADMVPAEALPSLLPHAWVFSTHYPSTHANTETYVAMFRRAGFVSDHRDAEPPTEPMTVYRGVPHARAEGADAIAWTLDLDVARVFSHRLDNLADPALFGEHVHVIEPTVWRAIAPPESVLAMFCEQNELEVVVDPGTLQEVEVIERSAPDVEASRLGQSPDEMASVAAAIAALRTAETSPEST